MKSEIVVGLGFGDEGKGTIVDYLARQVDGDCTVVRYNGGAQAAHNVVTPEGKHFTFAQFGSGTLAGARTHLSACMIVNPMNMLNEARELAIGCRQWDAFDRLTVDPDALVTTRFHMAYNRIQEIMRGKDRHGSCGQGVGATVEYGIKIAGRLGVLRVGHLADKDITNNALRRLREFYIGALPINADFVAEDHETLAYELDILRNLDIATAVEDYYFWSKIVEKRPDTYLDGNLIFEGAQGTLLDEDYGTAPYNTWSKCRTDNAFQILNRLGRTPTRTIGVTRTYMTRHGAGPFPTENKAVRFPEFHNEQGTYQGGWRQGWLDLGLLRYSLAHNGCDEIAVTHMDYLQDENRVAIGYERPFTDLDNIERNPIRYSTWDRDTWLTRFTVAMDIPTYITSHGPTHNDKDDLCVSTL